MKVHYPKLYNMAHLSLNVFTASKGSNNYILFIDKFSANFESEFIVKRSGLGLKMVKFCQNKYRVMTLDLCKKNSFSGSIFSILLTNCLKTLYRSSNKEGVVWD